MTFWRAFLEPVGEARVEAHDYSFNRGVEINTLIGV